MCGNWQNKNVLYLHLYSTWRDVGSSLFFSLCFLSLIQDRRLRQVEIATICAERSGPPVAHCCPGRPPRMQRLPVSVPKKGAGVRYDFSQREVTTKKNGRTPRITETFCAPTAVFLELFFPVIFRNFLGALSPMYTSIPIFFGPDPARLIRADAIKISKALQNRWLPHSLCGLQ